MSRRDERHATGQAAIDHRAERVHVRAMIDRLAAGLLGRHVRGRADHATLGQRPGRVGELRDPEVEHLPDAVVGEEQVVGLEIAMHDARGTRELEHAADLLDQRASRGPGRGPDRSSSPSV